MKILVIGGSGLIGAKLTRRLRQNGHEVIAASPRSGVNSISGEGLAKVLSGTRVVVDVANSPSFEDEAVLKFFRASTENLLAAEPVMDVKHHIALSVIGGENLPNSGYMRAKLLQEGLIRRSGMPFSILRSTQFFEFIGEIIKAAVRGNVVRLSPALLQPIAADDVAAALADLATAPPMNGTLEIAGPAKIPLDDLARRVLEARGDTRQVITDARALYFGAELNDRMLTPGDRARIGGTSLANWLDQSRLTP